MNVKGRMFILGSLNINLMRPRHGFKTEDVQVIWSEISDTNIYFPGSRGQEGHHIIVNSFQSPKNEFFFKWISNIESSSNFGSWNKVMRQMIICLTWLRRPFPKLWKKKWLNWGGSWLICGCYLGMFGAGLLLLSLFLSIVDPSLNDREIREPSTAEFISSY